MDEQFHVHLIYIITSNLDYALVFFKYCQMNFAFFSE